MRPGTIHFVVTVEDSLCFGNHFFNRETFGATLEAVVHEHFFGRTITNTTHAESFVILFKTFDYFQHAKSKMSHSLHICELETDPDVVQIDRTQFASLIFLVLYADQLHPDKPLAEVAASKKGWHKGNQFVHDHTCITKVVLKVLSEMPKDQLDFVTEFENTWLQICSRLWKQVKDLESPPLQVIGKRWCGRAAEIQRKRKESSQAVPQASAFF